MAEGVNKSNAAEAYKYNNPELKVFDTDGDGYISLFELDNIQDGESLSLIAQDAKFLPADNSAKTVESLESKLTSVKDEQGIFSSLWNGIKCLTGVGSSTKKCEQAIQDFKDGKISYEEADSIISGFSEKQKSSVNLVANILTGVAATAVVASAVMTGGLSLGVIATAAAVGAGTKAGIKFVDRATNKKEGDALDAKQIAKDALSGAVDGAVSVATMGLGTSAVTAKTVASQTIKETIKQGTIAGARAGAISGAITGAADYTIEAAIEEDVEFNIADLAIATVTTAAGGALAGGVMGGVSHGLQYKSTAQVLQQRAQDFPELSFDEIIELTDQATRLHNTYEKNIKKATSQIEDQFEYGDTIEQISGRAKSVDSVFEKLANKRIDGELPVINNETCASVIGDGYGTRVQMKSLTQTHSKSIIEDGLEGTGCSYDDFIRYISNDIDGMEESTIASLKQVSDDIIDSLKEAQNKDVFDSLIRGIKNKSIKFNENEINAYGEYSEFSKAQLEEIARVYKATNGEKITIVTKLDGDYLQSHTNVSVKHGVTIVETEDFTLTTDGAIKKSGYTSTQTNIVHPFNENDIGVGELQIRGSQVNKFADVEHIPYDIRQGKIKASNVKYSEIFSLIDDMHKDSYKIYNGYLTKVYNWLRFKELGIDLAEPVLEGTFINKSGEDISQQVIALLSRNGLSKFGH